MSPAVGKIIRMHHSSSRPRTWHSRPPQYATRRSHRDRFCHDSSPWAIRLIFFHAKPHDETFAWSLKLPVRWHCGKAQREHGRQSAACKQAQRSTHQGKRIWRHPVEGIHVGPRSDRRALLVDTYCLRKPVPGGPKAPPDMVGVRRPVPGQGKGSFEYLLESHAWQSSCTYPGAGAKG